MISKFKQYNESIKNLLVGPTEDEIWDSFKDLDIGDVFLRSAKIGFLDGIKYSFKKDNDICIKLISSACEMACAYNNMEILKYLFNHGFNKKSDKYNMDMLIQSATSNDNFDIVKFLIDEGADVNANKGFPLYRALRDEYFDMVKLLLENGAVLEDYMTKGLQSEKIKELIKQYHNKKINESMKGFRSKYGEKEDDTLSHYSTYKPNIFLNKSCELGSLKGIKMALESGADINNNEYSRPPIQMIIENEPKFEVVKFMLENGADVKQFSEMEFKLFLFRNPMSYETKELLKEYYYDNEFKRLLKKKNTTNESIKSLLVGPTKEEIWKNLGYDRTFDTPEEFLSYMIDGMKIKEKTPNNIYWEKDGKILFKQVFSVNILYVDYDLMWLVLNKIFSINYAEIQPLILKIVGEYINWDDFISCSGNL